MISTLPDPGQLVDVRQRRFVVTEIAKSALPPDPLRAGSNGQQHLVTLSSVEDDALGEELQVVWELEPGARVLEKAALPELSSFRRVTKTMGLLKLRQRSRSLREAYVPSATANLLSPPLRTRSTFEHLRLKRETNVRRRGGGLTWRAKVSRSRS